MFRTVLVFLNNLDDSSSSGFFSAARCFAVLGLFGNVFTLAWMLGFTLEKLMDYDPCTVASLITLSFTSGNNRLPPLHSIGKEIYQGQLAKLACALCLVPGNKTSQLTGDKRKNAHAVECLFHSIWIIFYCLGWTEKFHYQVDGSFLSSELVANPGGGQEGHALPPHLPVRNSHEKWLPKSVAYISLGFFALTLRSFWIRYCKQITRL